MSPCFDSGETRECSDQVRALPAELFSSQPEHGLRTTWVNLALCETLCQSMSQPGYPQLREIYLHMALLQSFDRKSLPRRKKPVWNRKTLDGTWNLDGRATSKCSLMLYELHERTKVQLCKWWDQAGFPAGGKGANFSDFMPPPGMPGSYFLPEHLWRLLKKWVSLSLFVYAVTRQQKLGRLGQE